ncbi:MAG: T9SS type A sorting domain-containing protein [Bacteroidota bacterium]|nr:T9SS type A sorting domain-containing protein [Bacteroidota bacterium]MDP3146254.1 T9SS type A sorting domain-containing protein [Bacteroidota bacterium]
MKKQLFSILISFVFFNTLSSQIAYKDVAGIFYARCTSCHHTGASNYPFMNYAQTTIMGAAIQNALVIGKMPPWSADTAYTRFQHERIITSSEKQQILNWISGGKVKGDTTLAPPAPIYSSQYQLTGNADLTLGIGTFTSTSSSTDKYYCFSIPSGLTQDRIIRAYEVVPGNKAIVHHAVITADTTGTYAGDLSGSCYNITGNLGIGTYAPGSKATVFPGQAPLKAGMYLKAGSKIIIQLHYPAGSSGQVDSTKIRLFFYPVGTTGVRRIYSTTPLQNWSMAIPANSVVPYSAYYPSQSQGLPAPISAFAVMPHSHLLCQSIIYYAVNPGIDTIPLIRINEWDFEWQDYFIFKKLVKIPAGYRLYSKHIYDNTTNNPNNPNSPPIMVFSNTGTKDEMLFDGMMHMNYQTGDELIDIEAIINSDPLLQVKEFNNNENTITAFAFPNPFNNSISIRYSLNQNAAVTIEITDILGKKIGSYTIGEQTKGTHTWVWDEKEVKGNSISSGIYFYKIKANNYSFKSKIIKQD